MKKTITIIAGIILSFTAAKAQNYWLADFEDLMLPVDSFYQDTSGADFMSHMTTFGYDWNSSWGGYWSGGFTYSTKRDSITSGAGNMYSAKTAIGHNSSNTYVVGQNGAKMLLPPMIVRNVTNSCYITNSTYAYNSMRDGDMFAKKFGGPTGNDPDWFKLTIKGSMFGMMSSDSIEFYLADFRFANNAQDYIVNTWQFVDITPLGMVDSLFFYLSSSDVGMWGMNTPAFFCMDDFSTPQYGGVHEMANASIAVKIYPMPIENEAAIEIESLINETATISVTNALGETITEETHSLHTGNNIFKNNFSDLIQGIYFLTIKTAKGINTVRFIKN